eukprot:CAMPEP_0114248102 /NCGR_PEP_ID=MMETSP0058-20121206/13385_1 /TAXON_ID=36894 /ORGANISM="Pyramimonas parkeae, CCMP726" /LENGTH=667 /DNA_ID=CAMNT_0001361469 /DNA_START=24 /DNA_END=2027 /DNA_ORIENTATION=-
MGFVNPASGSTTNTPKKSQPQCTDTVMHDTSVFSSTKLPSIKLKCAITSRPPAPEDFDNFLTRRSRGRTSAKWKRPTILDWEASDADVNIHIHVPASQTNFTNSDTRNELHNKDLLIETPQSECSSASSTPSALSSPSCLSRSFSPWMDTSDRYDSSKSPSSLRAMLRAVPGGLTRVEDNSSNCSHAENQTSLGSMPNNSPVNKLITPTRSSSFRTGTAAQRLGLSSTPRPSLDGASGARQPGGECSVLARAASQRVASPSNSRAEVERSIESVPSRDEASKTRFCQPLASAQGVSMKRPPARKEASSGVGPAVQPQRAAVAGKEAPRTWESRHAWYAQPWHLLPCGPGPTLMDFEVQFEIGEGLTSQVFLASIKGAKQLAPDKDDRVVLKSMRKDLVLEDRSVVKEVAEAEIAMLARAQQSRHVVRMMGWFESRTHIYLVMEWAPCDFFQLMSDHFGSERYWCNVRIYAAQVLMALEDIHRLGLIYCDLKPENLLVCMDGSLKLTDLGLAVPFPTGGERAQRACGTPEYMSPEMLSSSSGFNHMTDIWSFGIFVHEILTGTTPFKNSSEDGFAGSTFNQIRRHTSIHMLVNSEVTVQARNFIMGILKCDPAQRFGSQDIPGKYVSIRKHPWLASLNWKALEKGMNTPSIFPRANRATYKPVSYVYR